MSAIDRAFIRAYETDDADTATARPARQERRAEDRSAPTRSAPTTHFRASANSAQPERPADIDRRPLSSFAPPPSTVEASFRPALEVDGFRWSDVCNELVGMQKSRWNAAVETLLAADDAGRSLIGVGGARRKCGTTTIVQCLARLLAQEGKNVAVVDGDFATASLAPSLGMAADIGWEDVLAGRVPLAEAVVHSIGDGIVVLPLTQGGQPAAEKLDAIHASVTAGVLRYHYDLVLFDLGAVGDEVQGPIARRLARRCRLDGMLLISPPGNAAALGPDRLAQDAPELAAICLGIIENL